jgi:hypothetical protein
MPVFPAQMHRLSRWIAQTLPAQMHRQSRWIAQTPEGAACGGRFVQPGIPVFPAQMHRQSRWIAQIPEGAACGSRRRYAGRRLRRNGAGTLAAVSWRAYAVMGIVVVAIWLIGTWVTKFSLEQMAVLTPIAVLALGALAGVILLWVKIVRDSLRARGSADRT